VCVAMPLLQANCTHLLLLQACAVPKVARGRPLAYRLSYVLEWSVDGSRSVSPAGHPSLSVHGEQPHQQPGRICGAYSRAAGSALLKASKFPRCCLPCPSVCVICVCNPLLRMTGLCGLGLKLSLKPRKESSFRAQHGSLAQYIGCPLLTGASLLAVVAAHTGFLPVPPL
jgi:hypothetical protein